MAGTYMPSDFSQSYLNGIKKDYQKMQESCALFEQEHAGFCQRIGLDLGAFDITLHPDHPSPGIFRLPNLSDHDQQVLGEYLGDREKMYILEKCVRDINDGETRQLAEAYYLERQSQPVIAEKLGRTKSFVSKRLDKAEKNEMASTIDCYFEWKYTVPGGKSCVWAEEPEKMYMRKRDASHGIIDIGDLTKLPWVKSLRRLGF